MAFQFKMNIYLL